MFILLLLHGYTCNNIKHNIKQYTILENTDRTLKFDRENQQNFWASGQTAEGGKRDMKVQSVIMEES